jgi:hypothetical protein
MLLGLVGGYFVVTWTAIAVIKRTALRTKVAA